MVGMSAARPALLKCMIATSSRATGWVKVDQRADLGVSQDIRGLGWPASTTLVVPAGQQRVSMYVHDRVVVNIGHAVVGFLRHLVDVPGGGDAGPIR